MHGSSYARQQYIDYACGCSLLYKQTQGDDTLTFRTVITVSFLTSLGPTSFPGSLLLSSGRDPGCGWSRASQILGGKFNCNCERGGKGACL